MPDHTPAIQVTGMIEPHVLYTVEEFRRRTGLRDWALRSARRSGLRIVRRCGRNWIFGADFINWVVAGPEQGGESQELVGSARDATKHEETEAAHVA